MVRSQGSGISADSRATRMIGKDDEDGNFSVKDGFSVRCVKDAEPAAKPKKTVVALSRKAPKKATAKKPVAKKAAPVKKAQSAKTETTVVARDKEHLRKLIKAAITKNGNRCDLNFIDVSHVTDMSELFKGREHVGWDGWHKTNAFNGDISKWNVSNVKEMSDMFADSAFKGDISGWDLRNVKKGHGPGYPPFGRCRRRC